MKRLLLLVVSLFTMQAVMWADDDKPIAVDQLPQKAQQFIKQYFSESTIALAKMETDIFSKSYDVIFTNGNKAEFDKSGNWTEVDCKYSKVPETIIPTAIKTYVNQNYPNRKIIKIEKEDKGGYEVKLSDGWEVKFNKKFNVIDIDR